MNALCVGVTRGAVAVSLVLLSACGGPAPDGEANASIDPAAVIVFGECMSDAGYGTEEIGPPPVGDVPPDSIYADPGYSEALSRCIISSGAGTVDGDTPEEVAAHNERATTVTNCMKERGWQVPDPTMVGGPAGSEYLIPAITGPPNQDAETVENFHADMADCADEAGIPIVQSEGDDH